jgi:hypothetical protein
MLEHNRVLFADAYNHLVKIDSWFGSEIRDAIQEKGNRSDCRDARSRRDRTIESYSWAVVTSRHIFRMDR